MAPAGATLPPVIANAVSGSAATAHSHSLHRIFVTSPHPRLGNAFGPIRSRTGKGPQAPAPQGPELMRSHFRLFGITPGADNPPGQCVFARKRPASSVAGARS